MLRPSDVVACLAPSEFALLAVLAMATIGALHHRYGSGADRRSVRSRLHLDTCLWLIAVIAGPLGGALFVLDWNHAMSAGGSIDPASKAAFLAMGLRDASVHLGLGLATTAVALAARAGLVARALPAERTTSTSAMYWSVAGVVSALFLVVEFLFVTANFAPMAALRVDVGSCRVDDPSLLIRANGHVERIVGGRVVASAKVRDVSWLVSSDEHDVVLWADDGVSNASLVAVVDALRGAEIRGICFPADEREQRSRAPDPR